MEPIVRALINVEPASDLDTPAVTQTDLTVMQTRIDADCELDIELFEAVGNRIEIGHCLVLLELVIEIRDYNDPLRFGETHCGFTEPQEVGDLVRRPVVRVLDLYFVRIRKVILEDCFIREPCCAVVDSVVAVGSDLPSGPTAKTVATEMRPYRF